MTTSISKTELKDRMFEIFLEIEASGEELILTDHGKPVMKIVPIQPKESIETLSAEFQDQVVYNEDINTPTMNEWGEY